ncbi:DUF4097 domain-containing protein [Mycena chlorophos]|uniref:DUF4097 domain-containing protein n=1 Tax=Mycena chlorophos TaxID=658473 RepID=A0A8H6T8J5_MYCCL|nr:DUF4097 domain-containing protein [Mycena chlorophos]
MASYNEKAALYADVEDQPGPIPTYVTHEELAAALADQHKRHKKQKRRRAGRFLKVLGLIVLAHWAGHKYFGKGRRDAYLQMQSDHDWPVPTGAQIESCTAWTEVDSPELGGDTEYPYSATASFSLPADSTALFLATRSDVHGRHDKHRGLFSAGKVDYVVGDSDDVTVDIVAEYWHPEHLDATKACLLSRVDAEGDGVGILTKFHGDLRDHHHRSTEVRLSVTVAFPSSTDIKSFESDLEVYSQTFDAAVGDIHFGKLALKSALAGVVAEDLTVDNASIHTSLGSVKLATLSSTHASITTSMGRVEGTYNVTDSLRIHTANSRIAVNVNVLSSPSDDAEPATVLLTTSNAAIEANVSLASTKDDTPGSYDVAARTANGHIDLPILALPLEATLVASATTSLAKIHVSLPATYEGTLEGSTTLSSVDLSIDGEREDPKGEGRQRQGGVEQITRGLMKGKVGWSEDGFGRGRVEARSSLGAIYIKA